MNSKARTKNRASSRLAPIQKSRPENIWSIGENGRWGRRLRERQAGLLQICDGPWRQERCNSVTRHGAACRASDASETFCGVLALYGGAAATARAPARLPRAGAPTGLLPHDPL